ncbi:hypothetical protein ACWC0A_10840 [Streptomyces scopuliridis]
MELADVGIADSLDKADLHDGQLFSPEAGRFTFFDWGAAAVAPRDATGALGGTAQAGTATCPRGSRPHEAAAKPFAHPVGRGHQGARAPYRLGVGGGLERHGPEPAGRAVHYTGA